MGTVGIGGRMEGKGRGGERGKGEKGIGTVGIGGRMEGKGST